jgi:hypothetical protein
MTETKCTIRAAIYRTAKASSDPTIVPRMTVTMTTKHWARLGSPELVRCDWAISKSSRFTATFTPAACRGDNVWKMSADGANKRVQVTLEDGPDPIPRIRMEDVEAIFFADPDKGTFAMTFTLDLFTTDVVKTTPEPAAMQPSLDMGAGDDATPCLDVAPAWAHVKRLRNEEREALAIARRNTEEFRTQVLQNERRFLIAVESIAVSLKSLSTTAGPTYAALKNGVAMLAKLADDPEVANSHRD